MTNEITCGVCMDLMPLVRDGLASDDSREAVERHVRSCAACRALYSAGAPPAADIGSSFAKLKRRLRLFSSCCCCSGCSLA